ncbi:MAG: altronate dehydratase family protein [Spirochaetaceae bacterium]|jgi:altronate hydrolase|nr:altronate dehydratase family protein [Spirochaetaceae bacterium]
MNSIIRIDKRDNVAVALTSLSHGTMVQISDLEIEVKETIGQAHKVAIKDIGKGEHIIKYGSSIGHATSDIKAGDFVHTHNVKTNLDGILEYTFEKQKKGKKYSPTRDTFKGFRRANNKVGIRNEIWVINTVGCVNKSAEKITSLANKQFEKKCDGIFTFTHPYGCSQLGEDFKITQKILKNLINHPNAGAVLVLGLGCENNNIKEFKKVLGSIDEKRVRFLETQSVEDEIEEALSIIKDISLITAEDRREECSLSDLVIGLKCGGSDGLSGITANPLLGTISNKIIDSSGTSILSEVPEMFGAETVLMNRAKNEQIFNKTVDLINNFKAYFQRYNQVVYENPSPGNKDGGITTLEDKSLGCTQKGGDREVQAVLDYGEIVESKGLNLLNGPGNDMVAVTNLAASGCQLILFTTGRGTPLGGPVPTIKISSNSELALKKKNWIDFDAGVLTKNKKMDELSKEFLKFIISIASGTKTRNEKNDYREIAIFKDGVTL